MCIVSEKIKFCTCTSGSVEKLKHYWVLYRYSKDKDVFCIGMSIMPTSMRDFNFEQNQATLLNRLNEPDAFDIPIEFSAKDLLEIVINNNTSDFHESFTYSFKFKDGKWLAEEIDPFEIFNNFDEEKSGKMKSALKQNFKQSQ